MTMLLRPLALEFKESPIGENADFSLIEYDTILNLSVDKKTRQPAINALAIGTETFTKTSGEGTDSDINGLSMVMDTSTGTFASTEETDDDKDLSIIQSLMDTRTFTESSGEGSDQDRN
jgi:hypothetical protein